MRKLSILSLVFLSMLITGAAHGKVCFLGDPECQGVLAEKKTLEFEVVKCKKEYPNSINGKDKCLAKDYKAVCKDSTGDYYEEIGCKKGYRDIDDIRENGYVCKNLQCDHCCREEDIGCPEGYVDMDGTTETGRDYSYYYVCTDTLPKIDRCCREEYVKCREEYDVCTPPSENSKYPPELCYETDGSGRYIEKSMVCNCDEDVYKYDYDNCSKHNQLKLDGEPCTTRDGLYITSQKYPKCVCADGYELYTHREFLKDGPDECKCGYKPYDTTAGQLLPEVVDGQDAYCAPKIECLACCDTDKYKYTREECEISGMILGSDQCTEDHITHIKRYATSCVCDTSKGQYDTNAACKASKAYSTCTKNGNCYEVSGCETGYELNNNTCEKKQPTCDTSKGQYDTNAACKASKAHSTCTKNGNCYEVSGCETGYELNNNTCEKKQPTTCYEYNKNYRDSTPGMCSRCFSTTVQLANGPKTCYYSCRDIPTNCAEAGFDYERPLSGYTCYPQQANICFEGEEIQKTCYTCYMSGSGNNNNNGGSSSSNDCSSCEARYRDCKSTCYGAANEVYCLEVCSQNYNTCMAPCY